MAASYAENFDAYRETLDRFVRPDLRTFDIPGDLRILDVGCGFGDDIRSFRRMGCSHVVGIESDPYCVSKCGSLDVSSGSIMKTGKAPQSFDVVWVNNVFHHIDDYEAALDEVARVLKPGGLLCFVEPRRSVWRLGMDFITFRTPLRRVWGSLQKRYEVMSEELETGLYPKFLRSHALFFELLERRFDPLWVKNSFFFILGKVRKRG